nr:hypothetical protein [Tanacetum cinerariifolium]
MNYLEEQTDGETMINSIKNEKKIQKINRLARSLLIQGLPNDIYSLIDSNKTAKDLWDALARHMLGSNYGDQDRKAAVLSLVAEQTKVSKRKEKVVVSSESEGSDDELKKITSLLDKAFNHKKFYSKPTNNNLRTSLATSSATSLANKKQEYMKSDDKKEEKKDDKKKRDMSKHMMGNRALLTNFVEKFLGMVCFGNNDFAVIAGYKDVVIRSMMIKKVYYVEGLDGVDLLTGDRSLNLYTIDLNEVASNSLACLLAKDSSSQSWLWHQRLSHLNFATINNLVKNYLVQGDIEVFVGYSKASAAFRIYNKRTRKIHESVNVNFDEISEMSSKEDFTIFQMDVKIPFLNGILKEEVYVGQPLSFISKQYPDHVYALDKAFYGLKQAPRAWYNVLSQFLIDNSFEKGSIDTTLFIKKKGKHIMLIQIYDDDIIFGSTNLKYYTKFSDLMVKRFEMSMMGEIKFFLRIQVNQFLNEIFINQSKYILDILKRFGIENCDTVPNPMVKQAKLKLDLVRKPVDHTDYHSMIGSLMYVTSSRPDIMFARYADHVGCHLDRKKSEYVSVSGCCAKVLWMRTQLTNYGFFYDKVSIYCALKSAIAISCNPVQHTRTKHIDV